VSKQPTFLVSHRTGQPSRRHGWTAILLAAALLTGCGRKEPEPAAAPPVPPPAPPAQSAAAPPEQPRVKPAPSFFEAALEGELDRVARALGSGVTVDARDGEGHTALMLAAFNGHVDLVRYLLDAGADPALRDPLGRTALMFACTGANLDTVRELLKRGARVNAVDAGEHWTPLMFAAAEGQHDIVQALLAAGADAALRDTDGDTARDFARQRGHTDVAATLAAAADR